MPRFLSLLICVLALAVSPSFVTPAAAQQSYDPDEQVAWEPRDDDWHVGAEEWDADEEPVEDFEPDYVMPEPVEVPLVKTKTVAGRQAMLRADGKAAVPRSAPARVKAIIAAANRIVGKPYKWGGGHASVVDRGYDCSGSVSFPLIKTGMLPGPLVSGGFARWGAKGAGRWVTIYANKGHVYMEVAGLRLDTSEAGDPRGGKGPRWRPVLGKRRGFAVRHPAGM